MKKLTLLVLVSLLVISCSLSSLVPSKTYSIEGTWISQSGEKYVFGNGNFTHTKK